MALNRSSEFEPKTQCNKSFWYPEATIWANLEELYFAMLNTKFQVSEPSGSEADFFTYFPICFYG